ncbi:SDR family oxidoreductase [Marinomonas sp. IMCC 4694]|uniref:SDR family oxidoreductase n=1 Tax=Marinomonas sp. IMCC 4694 TaxID=2605432 RepID=UPI0011E6CB35|nr:SDR family NAD(P)-dependent oxidoreductase [Marinomonas sp. IMCC 4694]TYL49162.1 SDR family NAD(P)-dependent oxidoreductase [Marinomonas sp. IMCC 4694]
MKLTNNIVLITGGASGIGATMAERFKNMGNTVIICGRNKEKLAQAASTMGVDSVICDISSPEQCQSMLNTISKNHGRLDILVNCAGVMFAYDFANDLDTATKIQTEIEINAIAPLQLTHAALPLLKQSKAPAIVFVSSGLAYVSYFATPAYSGSKALIHHSAQALRHQLKPHGIQVFELLPPITDTPMAEGMNTGHFKKMAPSAVIDELINGMQTGKVEIAAGASKQLHFMSRLAPNFLFKQMVKSFT